MIGSNADEWPDFGAMLESGEYEMSLPPAEPDADPDELELIFYVFVSQLADAETSIRIARAFARHPGIARSFRQLERVRVLRCERGSYFDRHSIAGDLARELIEALKYADNRTPARHHAPALQAEIDTLNAVRSAYVAPETVLPTVPCILTPAETDISRSLYIAVCLKLADAERRLSALREVMAAGDAHPNVKANYEAHAFVGEFDHLLFCIFGDGDGAKGKLGSGRGIPSVVSTWAEALYGIKFNLPRIRKARERRSEKLGPFNQKRMRKSQYSKGL